MCALNLRNNASTLGRFRGEGDHLGRFFFYNLQHSLCRTETHQAFLANMIQKKIDTRNRTRAIFDFFNFF